MIKFAIFGIEVVYREINKSIYFRSDKKKSKKVLLLSIIICLLLLTVKKIATVEEPVYDKYDLMIDTWVLKIIEKLFLICKYFFLSDH